MLKIIKKKTGIKLEKIDHKLYIKQNSSFINKIIFTKKIEEYLLLNDKNIEKIKELKSKNNNKFIFSFLESTYLDFIKEIKKKKKQI